MVEVDFRPHVVIVTKRKVYDLEPDAVGQPMEEVLGKACPASLRVIRRYIMEDGWIVTRPEQPA